MSLLNAEKLAAANLTISTLFNKEFELVEDPIRNLLANEVQSDTAVEEYDAMGDVPGLSEWKGDRKVSDLRAEGMQLKNKKYSTGFRVPMDAIKDDKLGLITPKVADAAEKAGYHYGKLLGDYLKAGFGTTLGTTRDGKALFATDHQEGDAPAQSNKGTAALSMAAYKAARAVMMKWTDDTGDYSAASRPTHLIVGPDLEGLALEIAKAMLIDNTAGTATKSNVYQGSVEVIVTPAFKGSAANYWCLGALGGALKPLILQLREAITMTPMTNPTDPNVFWRDEALWGIQGRHAVGYGSWRRIWGSDGTT